jgi:hypothetical protein
MTINKLDGLRFNKIHHSSLNYANIFCIDPQAHGLYTPQIKTAFADGLKMAAASQGHNQIMKLSTTLPIIVYKTHNQSVWL